MKETSPRKNVTNDNTWDITLPLSLINTVEFVVTWLFLLPDHDETTFSYPDGKTWDEIPIGTDARSVTFHCVYGSNNETTSKLFSLAHCNVRDVQVALRVFSKSIITNALTYSFPGFRDMKAVMEKINDNFQTRLDDAETQLTAPLREALCGIGCVNSGNGGRIALPHTIFHAVENERRRKVLAETERNTVILRAAHNGRRVGARNKRKKRR